MIVVRLTGGLGNQLFQYAAGTALADRNGTGVKLDLSTLPLDGREFKLNAFQIEAKISHLRDRETVPTAPGPRLLHALKRRVDNVLEEADNLRPWYMRRVVVQPYFHFAPEFFEANPSCILEGYWQSPKYFAPVERLIRRHLTLTETANKPSEWDEQIDRPDSVGLHVRRGDYVSNPLFAAKYRQMDRNYYAQALELVKASTGAAKVFVFSDDLNWCRENLVGLGDLEFVNGGSDIGDFRLMSRCSHHVISNSTFAWWAAWLGYWYGQCVVAPSQWFCTDNDLRDLFPPAWNLV